MVNAAKQAGGASKPKPLAARNNEDGAKPYATEATVSEYLRQTAATEKALMTLSMEKSQLESEYAKMGITSGRTLQRRRRKAEIERRLDEVAKEQSKCRFRLKSLHALR